MNVHLHRSIRYVLAAACFVAVAAAPADAQRFDETLNASSPTVRLADHRGLALPVRSVTLSAPVDGTLASIFATDGDVVAAGDLVAQMNEAVQAAVVETARVRMASDAAIKRAAAEVKAAAAELDRVRASHERQAASELELLRAEARFDAADADHDQALENQAINTWTMRLEQARLDEYSLRSPFDGVVIRKEAEPGTSLQQSTPVVTLAQLDTLEAEIYLPVDLGMPKAGRRYVLNAGSPIQRKLTATLTFVSPVIDPASRTFRCKFTIENGDLALPAGFDVHLASLEPVAEESSDNATEPAISTAE
ncbi:MAG: efflux RND transporter periplasmic adaptor subunit [Planctomycetota bacterium]